MRKFLDEHFLLTSDTAVLLYHQYASQVPVIDYHNHLSPEQIAHNHNFDNLTQIWLNGDHYKWRAMRANGVDEHYITGDATDLEKFKKWAETVPYTMRNPLYHWTHLELQRYFGVYELLGPDNAERIYELCSAKLRTPEYSVQNLLRMMNVELLCTTDDPLDSLIHHKRVRESGFEVRVLPAFRPDKAMFADDLTALNTYIDQLALLVGLNIDDLDGYLAALKSRHDYFAAHGCQVSDHGLDRVYSDDYTEDEVASIFLKIRRKELLSTAESGKFKSKLLFEFALWDHEKGWVQQYHIGALRNNNERLLSSLGPDTGFDSIGDFAQSVALSKFLNRLDRSNRLAKTIIYNLNPADNEVFASMTGNFQDGTVAGKVQWGSAWWFLDQKDGMVNQLNTLSNMGLLSRFVGMLTDSRSFLSFPRHEYFRRILCELFAADVQRGELPGDMEWIGKIIQDVCYRNAKAYFNFNSL